MMRPALRALAVSGVLAALAWAPRAARGEDLVGKISLEPVSADQGVTDAAVVYVTGFNQDPPEEPVVVGQINRRFVPDVLAVTRGQKIRFRNEDTVKHNVFSYSNARSFDLGLTDPTDTREVTFGRTGIVDVFCNIHHEMIASILVLPNRAYAVVHNQEQYRISGLAPGTYAVHVFHRLAKPVQQTVEVAKGKGGHQDFTLKLDGKILPHLNKYGRPYDDRKKY